jgi:hypothetical protein
LAVSDKSTTISTDTLSITQLAIRHGCSGVSVLSSRLSSIRRRPRAAPPRWVESVLDITRLRPAEFNAAQQMLPLTPQDRVADAAFTATAEHNTTVGFTVRANDSKERRLLPQPRGCVAASVAPPTGAREYYRLIIVFWQQTLLERQDSFLRPSGPFSQVVRLHRLRAVERVTANRAKSVSWPRSAKGISCYFCMQTTASGGPRR